MKLNKTFILLRRGFDRQLPHHLREQDVRFSESLARLLIGTYSKRGDAVFDPFAGFGTTLFVSESMGRKAYGLEYSAQRVRYMKSLLRSPEHCVLGDARKIDKYGFPLMNCCIASPPYMNVESKMNPFTHYTTRGLGYKSYLKDMGKIYAKLSTMMKKKGSVIIVISNMKIKKITPLAWDVAAEVSKHLTFKGEKVIAWQGAPEYGYNHDYCLIFQK